MSTQKLNASFNNNRNNGMATAKTPLVNFESGDFLVYTGLGGVIPYAASETLFMTITGTFQVGETVTQATSGATGIVVDNGTNFGTIGGITIKTITGTFDTSHVVTGGTSSATGTPTSILANTKILGLSNSFVNSASANWATTGDVNVSTPVAVLDFLDIPVSAGTPSLNMVGKYVNVDPANPGQVDVGTVSAVSGQILVTRIVSPTMIKGVIANAVA